MDVALKFSAEDLDRIKKAVKQAEEKISGEIVPVVVENSGHYTVARYKAAIGGALLMFVILIVADRYAGSDTFINPMFTLLGVATGGVLGSLLPVLSPAARRLMLTRNELDYATRQRARSIFLEEEVFNTRHRTGILIFISLFEQEVIIMADRGISKVVEQSRWNRIVQALVRDIQDKKITAGLETAIGQCSHVLLEHGFRRTSDDVNELRDDLRMS